MIYLHGVSGPEHGAADSTESTKLPSFIEELGGVGLNQISKPDRRTLLAGSEGLPMGKTRRV